MYRYSVSAPSTLTTRDLPLICAVQSAPPGPVASRQCIFTAVALFSKVPFRTPNSCLVTVPHPSLSLQIVVRVPVTHHRR